MQRSLSRLCLASTPVSRYVQLRLTASRCKASHVVGPCKSLANMQGIGSLTHVTMSESPVAQDLLPLYYADVISMREYLSRIVPHERNATLWQAVPPAVEGEWRSMLDGLIGLDDAWSANQAADEVPYELARINSEPSSTPRIVRVMEYVQAEIQASKRSDVLLLGYKPTPGISSAQERWTNTHPNTILTSLLLSTVWYLLLERLGLPTFAYLLLHSSFFLPLDAQAHDTYVQMWGMPLSERQPRRDKDLGKILRPARVASLTVPAQHIYLPRSMLFYARPHIVARRGVCLGLPPDHPFYRTAPSTHYERRMHVARLVQSMFPQAFGQGYAWQPRVPKRVRRWPKHLQTVASLVTAMLQRHAKFRYDRALELCCPSALPRGRAARERRSRLATQFAGPEAAVAPWPNASTQADTSLAPAPVSRMATEPRFFKYATSAGRVSWFVRLVLHHVVPFDFFGSVHNRRVVCRGVKRLIQARRYERVSLFDVLQGFRTRDCVWLAHPDPHWVQRRLCEWFWWLFVQLIIPLLRTTFYATDTAAFRQRVLYFRQDVWVQVSRPLLERLRAELFERVEEPVDASVPYATVRLVPKETTVRPIINLRRRVPGIGRSMNAQLQSAFDVLSYEAARQPERLGAAVGSMKGLYMRLKAYKDDLLATHSKLPRLYMVRADIRAAFDSLDHDQLLKVVRALLPKEASYVVQRYTHVHTTDRHVWRVTSRRAWPDAHYPSFVPSMRAQATTWHHVVLMDGVTYPVEQASEILERVEAHITRSLVRLGPALYRQRRGIPQGSILSSLLCNLLLADAERTYLPLDPADCLLRLTDDYLFVSPSLERARAMCLALYRGFPQHGCHIAPHKCLVNFDMLLPHGYVVPRIAAQAPFPWCGVQIHPCTLGIASDTQRYPFHMGDTLSVRRGGLGAMLIRLVRQRTMAIFTDTALNTVSGAYTNLLESFVLAAAKLHVWLRHLPYAHLPHVLRVITHAVLSAWPLLRVHTRAAAPGAQFQLKRRCVEWLGWFAFARVLRHWRQHDDLVAELHRTQLEAPYYVEARRIVGRLALEAWPAHARRVQNAT